MSKKEEPSKKAPTAAELQADLEAKRAELANSVDALTAQLDPKQNIADLKAQLSDTAANASEEAQAFVSRVQEGDRQAQQIIALTALTVVAVTGLALIRRGR